MSYDLARLDKECREAIQSAGVKFDGPIELNSRLTRTLGRVMYSYNCVDKIQFSTHLIENSTDETIRNIVLHECAHVIAFMRTHERQGHNSYFKSICAELGTTNDGTTTHVEQTVAAKAYHRYTIICPNCGEIGGRQKMCASLRDIKNCWCIKCGESTVGKLTYIQNW